MRVDEFAQIMRIYMMQNLYLSEGENSTDLSSMFSLMLDNILQNMDKDSQYINDNKADDKINNISDAIKKASQKYNVEESLIKAVIDVESSFNPMAVSKAGAQGLMQLMPQTQKSLGVDNPFDVLENIDGGTRYLRTLLDAFSGNKELALAAYNGGIGRMKKLGVDSVEEIQKMPKETQSYISKVLKEYSKY
ncbi:Soluble lytic murein transglycosylase [Caloramator quimbayensis]|uniref:Soluble lytic murein transglycosylase n=1 Tax=Caloramator quimbayensis TaxID=1147123 RepID=A0A1T4XQ92_9CLOT|nr:lytic transglycosylase domain-containing protein [Caloramator quimbayensis]SKA91729.1 Soluble lytic murein transglycosylase [Caloramator quimbayensis]